MHHLFEYPAMYVKQYLRTYVIMQKKVIAQNQKAFRTTCSMDSSKVITGI